MANALHLEILLRSPSEWNEWRLKNRHVRPDLRGARLRERNLSGADFRSTDFRGADLHGADLSRANLIGADLRECKLELAHLAWIEFDDTTKWPVGFDPTDTGFAIYDTEAEQYQSGPPSYDFEIRFDSRLSPNQVTGTLAALADFYRSCGGIGFETDLEAEYLEIQEPVHVRR